MRDPVMSIVPARAKLRVQTWNAAALQDSHLGAALRTFLEASWPTEVGTAAGSSTRALCQAPTEWLVVADMPPRTLLERLEKAVAGSAVIVTDQSQGLAALELNGSRARELLSKGCCLDLHARAFPAGACARTRLAHVPVVIDSSADGATLTCYVARSYLDYLQNWLADAAEEFQDAHP
jgi:sarcosine oxidase, subunit gamma